MLHYDYSSQINRNSDLTDNFKVNTTTEQVSILSHFLLSYFN